MKFSRFLSLYRQGNNSRSAVKSKGAAALQRAAAATSFENLESRTLMSFSAMVNFAPASAAKVSGYVVDSGATYAARNGLTYGWNTDISANTRDRNAWNSTDQLHDTLIHAPSGAQWDVAVPNGTYNVKLVAGDPSYWDSTYRINVEGKSVISATPTTSSRWATGTIEVTVTDGKLTINNGTGAVNNKLDFVEITASGSTGSGVIAMSPAPASALIATATSTR